jgi:predicted secreted protein
VQNLNRLCENSKNIEKWRAAIELLRASERAMDEKCRKSPAISWLPPARSSFHTVCKTSATRRDWTYGAYAT